MTGLARVVDFVLAATAAPESADNHRDDLVMLGTIETGTVFWPCHLWGEAHQRSDFVHVSQPCRDRDGRS